MTIENIEDELFEEKLVKYDLPQIHKEIKRIADAMAPSNKEVLEYIWFIEELEALTKDPDTADRIKEFLTKKNIWKSPANLD